MAVIIRKVFNSISHIVLLIVILACAGCNDSSELPQSMKGVDVFDDQNAMALVLRSLELVFERFDQQYPERWPSLIELPSNVLVDSNGTILLESVRHGERGVCPCYYIKILSKYDFEEMKYHLLRNVDLTEYAVNEREWNILAGGPVAKSISISNWEKDPWSIDVVVYAGKGIKDGYTVTDLNIILKP